MTRLFRRLQPAQKFRITVGAIEHDYTKHKEQYADEHYPFLCQFWAKHWAILWKQPDLSFLLPPF